MMATAFVPVKLSDDVHIMYKTNAGCYIIMYRKADGKNSIIYLPESCNTNVIMNSKGADALKLVTEFLAGKVTRHLR